jgi:hypothetical protein
MKNLFYLTIFLSAFACNKPAVEKACPQTSIEPCDYEVMSYKATDSKHHSFIISSFGNKPVVKARWADTLIFSDYFGKQYFGGIKFSYKVLHDSIYLSNKDTTQVYPLIELKPNSFSIGLKNKYVKKFDFVKPKAFRRPIRKTVTLDF